MDNSNPEPPNRNSKVVERYVNQHLGSCLRGIHRTIIPTPKECLRCFSRTIKADDDEWGYNCTCSACGYTWTEKHSVADQQLQAIADGETFDDEDSEGTELY